WLPFSKFRCLELYTIMASSSIMIVRQLFIGPKRHQPFDPDGPLHRSLTEHGLEQQQPLVSCFSRCVRSAIVSLTSSLCRQHELGRTIPFAHFRFPRHHSNRYGHATKEQIDGVYSEKVNYLSPV
ncbi:unnamed protein product, partial [Brassica oleracea]